MLVMTKFQFIYFIVYVRFSDNSDVGNEKISVYLIVCVRLSDNSDVGNDKISVYLLNRLWKIV